MTVKREPWTPLLKSFPESRKINAVCLGAEAMFIRLLALCDDHSNFYADPRLLLVHLFGNRYANGTVSLRNCTRMRNELIAVGLVEIYDGDGDLYLHVVNCKKMLRADIKEDKRFPDFAQPLTEQELTERVPNAARMRNEFVSSSVAVSVDSSVAVSVDSPSETEALRERQATELVTLYRENIRRDGPKARAIESCARLLKTIAYGDLKKGVERLVADHVAHPWDHEYRASNFFGPGKAYYRDFVGDAYEPRQVPAGGKSNVRRKEGAPERDIHEGPYRQPEKVEWGEK